jgi:DNA repair protein RecN (Recombination protein N)
MLRELRIKNFAVIDELVLELGQGLNVLTGETGAGKSIILNALGLISGGRVTSEVIRHNEEEATVEALFEEVPEAVRQKLEQAGYEVNDDIVIKRVVSRAGKNRIYLGGSLCPLSVLSEIGPSMVHIYGQHEHHALLKPEVSFLDERSAASVESARDHGKGKERKGAARGPGRGDRQRSFAA